MMKKLLTCFFAMLGLTSACGQQNYEDVDVQQFAALVGDTDVVVLDVRTAGEFREGYIEKAKATLPADRKIAVYCRSGRRSANACRQLAAEGYQVVNLKGGIMAWTGSQMPVKVEE